ncbi:winged helix-turn-helix domain-containing protein [Dokdonella sp.]|uniref:winged helix-turn-helix domain-containing protein n=1 Tax=Dokdonella sp. TaxID=2291710 RepID=UPI00261362EE|nr:winged helix-turn-helix domain-containing protein [Dokdonella sp.]
MASPVHRYGDYRIDPSARELQHAGDLVVLSPKVFDSLAYLIEHRDRAVGRDELIAAVWGRTDVSDTLLGQTVLKARRAVGDTGNDQKAIRTIPRFGYRWVGELQVDLPAESTPASSEPTVESPAVAEPGPAGDDTASVARTRPARRFAAPAALAFVVILAAGFAAYRHRAVQTAARTGADVQSPVQTIAVLPVSVSAGEEWHWLRLGLMDLIGTRLRRGGLAVVPSDNVVAATHAQAGIEPSPGTPGAATSVKERTGAHQEVSANLTRLGPQWQLRLELRDGGNRRTELQVQGSDPVEIARTACDRLLATLGRPPLPPDADEAELSLAELAQRVEAALLIDDFATARRLIESAPPSQRDTPELRLRLAQIEFRTGEAEAARKKLDSLLDTVSAESAPVLRARVLHTLGAIAIRDSRGSDAAKAFEEAVRLTETRREPGVLGKAYTGLGVALRDLRRYDESAAALARARVALSLAGDTLGLSAVDDNEGLLDNSRGRPAEALPALRRAAATNRQFGLVNDLALVAAAQIDTHLLLLDPAAALLTAEEFLPLRPSITNPRGRNSFDLRYARALLASGRMADARTVLDDIEQSPVAANQAGMAAAVAMQRALIDLSGGEPETAATHARRAQEELASLQQGDASAEAWSILIHALRASGQHASARDEVERFGRWVLTAPDLARARLLSTLASAEQAWIEQRRDDAGRLYTDALGQAERRAVPEDTADVVTSWGNALISDKDLDRASAVVGRAARWSTQDFGCALLQARLYRALGETDAWHAALDRARALAGERPLPATVSAPALPLGHDAG